MNRRTIISGVWLWMSLPACLLASGKGGSQPTQKDKPLPQQTCLTEETSLCTIPWDFDKQDILALLKTKEYYAYSTSIGKVVSNELYYLAQNCSPEEKANHQANLKQISGALRRLEEHLNSTYVTNSDNFWGTPVTREQVFNAAEKIRYLQRELSGKF